MGSKKTTTNTTNSYGYAPPTPSTPEFEAYKAAKFDNTQLSPTLEAQFNDARRSTEDQYSSPWNGIGSSVQRNAMQSQALQRLNQAKGLATSQANLSNQQMNINKQYTEAMFTKPQLVQTGSNSTQTQSGGWLNALVGAGLMAAAPFTMGTSLAALGPAMMGSGASMFGGR